MRIGYELLFRDKLTVLQHISSFLKPAGALLLVEYNVDRGNPWVPYSLSSGLLGEFYSVPTFIHTQVEPVSD